MTTKELVLRIVGFAAGGLACGLLLFAFSTRNQIEFFFSVMGSIAIGIRVLNYADKRFDPSLQSSPNLRILRGEIFEAFLYACPGFILGYLFALWGSLTIIGWVIAGAIGFCFVLVAFSVSCFFFKSPSNRFLGGALGGLGGILIGYLATFEQGLILGILAFGTFLLWLRADKSKLVRALPVATDGVTSFRTSVFPKVNPATRFTFISSIKIYSFLFVTLIVMPFAPFHGILSLALYGGLFGSLLTSLRILVRFHRNLLDFRGVVLSGKVKWLLVGSAVTLYFVIAIEELFPLSHRWITMNSYALVGIVGGAVIGFLMNLLIVRRTIKTIQSTFITREIESQIWGIETKLDQEPSNSTLRCQLSVLYMQLGRSEQAAEQLRKIMKSDINFLRSHMLAQEHPAVVSGLTDWEIEISAVAAFFIKAGLRITRLEPETWKLDGRNFPPFDRFYRQYKSDFVAFLVLDPEGIRIGEDLLYYFERAWKLYQKWGGGPLDGRLSFLMLRKGLPPGAESQVLTWRFDTNLTFIPLTIGDISKEVVQPSSESGCFNFLRKIVWERTGRANLYDKSAPVRDQGDFYGRVRFLQELRAFVRKRTPVALYGVNKIGKTSILFRFGDVCESHYSMPVVYIDLDSLARNARFILETILRDVMGKINLSERHVSMMESLVVQARETSRPIESIAGELVAILSEAKLVQPIILLIDEWDLFFPTSSEATDGFHEFLPFLRALSQMVSGSVFIPFVSGIYAGLWQKEKWDSYTNPTISLFKPHPVKLFDETECREMIVGIGSQMGVEYTDDALSEVFQQSGGHPYIARKICGNVFAKSISEHYSITLDDVRDASRSYANDVSAVIHKDIWKLWNHREQEILRRIASARQKYVPFDYLIEGIQNSKAKRDAEESLGKLQEYSMIKEQKGIEGSGEVYGITIGALRQWIRNGYR